MFLYDCQNYFRRVQRHTFRRTMFLLNKKLCFHHFRTLNESFSGSRQNVFGLWLYLFSRVFKIAFYLSWKTVGWNIFFLGKKYVIFKVLRHWMKILLLLSKITWGVCQHCFLRVQRKLLGMNVFFEKRCFYLHLLVQWMKKVHHYGKIFWSSAYTVTADCQNCLLLVQ